MAQSNKGLTNSNDIKEYTRLVNQLEKAYGILNVKAQGFADVNNYSKESAEVKKYMNQLQGLIQKQDSLRKAAEDYIDTNKKSLKLNEDEAKALKKSIANAEAYKKVVDEIVESKMKAAQQKMGAAAVKATGGQQALDEIDNRPGKFDFSAAEKKGRDSSRKALVNKNGTVKEDEAIIAANLEYNRILKETIQNGGSAEDAMAELTKTMKAYKLELTNADEVQKQFAEDIEKVYEAASQSRDNLNQGEKTALTKGMNERNAAKNLQSSLTNESVTNVQQNANQITDAENQVNQALEKRVQELEQIIGLMKTNASAAEQASNTEIENERQVINEAERYVGIQEKIQNGFDRISNGAKQILSVTTAWRSLRNVIKGTYQDVTALDKAFASIAMVTNYSVKDMWSQYDKYAEMANKLGQSTKSVVEASALYYQQGLKTNEVMQLTEETMKLATLAGLDFKEATSQMTAALRAFHMDMSEGAHVTDVYAEVAAHAAVDVQGLSEAMSACAAIANSSGMSFENTTAMLATMTEATQEAPKNLGTAMKTILARFTELKNNVAGTADSEFDDLDYNKVDKALKSVGISIKDASGQFKNMDEVLLELSSKWNTLDRNSQRYIATIAAGSRQQSRFIALMENYERTMQLVDVAQNSAGRSSQQFAKYQDSVEYQINKLSNTWEQFRTSILGSDFFKGLLGQANSFLSKITEMNKSTLVGISTMWLTLGRSSISKITGSYSNLISGITGSGTGNGLAGKFIAGRANSANEKLENIKQERNKLWEQGDYEGANALAGTQDKLQGKANKLDALSKDKEGLKKIGSNIGTIIATGITTAITIGVTEDDPVAAGLEGAAASALTLGPTFIQLGMQLGGPMGAAIGAGATVAIAGLSALISGIRAMIAEEEKKTAEWREKHYKEEIENTNKLIEEKKSTLKADQEEQKSLENIKKEYEDLKDKVYKTQEEQERYNSLVSTLQSDYPELISYYNEETGQLELQNSLLDEKIEKNKLLQEQTEKNIQANMMQNINNQQELDKAEDELKFKDKLKDSGYKKRDVQEKDEYGNVKAYHSGLDETDVLNRVKDSGKYDLDSLKEEFEKELKQGTITNEELKTIAEISKQSLATTHDYSESYLNLAKEKIYSDKENDKLSEAEKKALVTSTAALMEVQQTKFKTLVDNYDDEDFERDHIKGTLEDLKKSLPKNGTFNFDVDKMSDMVYDIQKGWNTEDDWEDLKKSTKEQLEKIGITTEEEYKKLVDSGAASEEEAAKRIVQLIANYAGSGATLSEKGKKVALDAATDSAAAANADASVEERLKRRDELLDKYKDKSQSVKKIINDSFTDLEKYSNALDRFGLSGNEYLQNMSSDLIPAMTANLGKLFDQLAPMGEDKAKVFMSKFYSSLSTVKLTGQTKDVIFNLDFTQFKDKNKDEIQKILIDMLTDDSKTGHVAKEEGQKIAEQIMKGMEDSGIINFSAMTADGLKQSIEEIGSKKKEIVSAYQDLMNDINSEIGDKGYIDVLNIDKFKENLEKMGLEAEKYLSLNKNGNYVIDYDAINKDVDAQLGLEEELTKELKAQQEQGIAQLDLEIARIDALISGQPYENQKLKILQAQTDQLAAQAALSGKADLAASKIVTNATGRDINNVGELSATERDALKKQRDALQEQRDKLAAVDVEEEAQKQTRALYAKAEQIEKSFYETLEENTKKQKEARDNAYDDWVSKSKAVEDAKKSLAKAIENVTEKQKELADVIKGTNWESSLDGMYNYDTALDSLVKQTERAKKKLDKSMSEDESKRNAELYGQSLLNQKANIGAQRQVYEKAISNYNQTYREKLGPELNKWEKQSKTKFDPSKYVNLNNKTGRYEISVDKLQKDQLPKEIKSWVENYVKTVNDYQGKIEDLRDKEEELDEQYLEWKKQVRDDYIDLQQKMMDVLREKYQKEIDDLKNKYDAMEEADQKYLEALQKNIDRQRKLRDQENSWNELADKERKLSLMQRDTSSGNIGEVKSLEKEIEDDRTSLLDTAVDDIIEKLQEFYDLQKENRDAEIEYKETLLSDVNLLKEVTEELKKIHTSEDLVNWWKNNVSNIASMSKEEFDREKDNWSNLISAKVNYATSIDEAFQGSIEKAEGGLQDVTDETQKVVKSTSEQITKLADTTLEKAGKEYSEAIKKAKEALADAVDAVQKQKDALAAAEKAALKAKEAFEKISEKYNEVLSQLEKEKKTAGKLWVNDKGESMTYEAFKRYMEENHGKNYGGYKETTVTKHEQEVQQKKEQTSAPAPLLYETNYVGKNSVGDVMLYGNKNNFNDHNQYKNSGEVTIDYGVQHGVLAYDSGKDKWTFVKDSESLSKKDAEKFIDKIVAQKTPPAGMPDSIFRATERNKYFAFAQGGLVDYTGPAWVDGSRSRPEAFLSAEDTRRIGEAAKILADLPILSQPVTKDKVTNNTVGDVNIQIEVNVDKIANDYDVDEAVERVEKILLENAKYVGANVILKKR